MSPRAGYVKPNRRYSVGDASDAIIFLGTNEIVNGFPHLADVGAPSITAQKLITAAE